MNYLLKYILLLFIASVPLQTAAVTKQQIFCGSLALASLAGGLYYAQYEQEAVDKELIAFKAILEAKNLLGEHGGFRTPEDPNAEITLCPRANNTAADAQTLCSRFGQRPTTVNKAKIKKSGITVNAHQICAALNPHTWTRRIGYSTLSLLGGYVVGKALCALKVKVLG